MKTTPNFKLDALERDWIQGIAGNIFLQRVKACIARIEATDDSATEQGVLIAEPDPVEFAAAFFASVYSGVPVILTNPKWQQFEWEQLRSQVNPAVVFGESGISKVREVSEVSNPKRGAILIPTGGSSGKLKLAVHTWETLLASCQGFRSFVGSGPIHSCCVLQLYHVSGLMQLMRSFVSGGEIVFADYKALEAGQFPEIAAEKLCLSLVPTQLQRMLEQRAVIDWLCSLQAIFLGGAPMSSSLRACAHESRLPVVPTYGMTETATMITTLPSKIFLSGNSSVGYALKHATVQVVHENGSHCLPEERGRIHIQARSLCLGYHGLPSEILQNGYLSTDEGYLDHEGCLHIVGRSDRIIISGGEKVDPLEVEAAFFNTGMIEQVLVTGWPDTDWGERLVAFYVAATKPENDENLRQHLQANLVNYKIPRQIIQVEQLPLSTEGKPDRALIRKLMEDIV